MARADGGVPDEVVEFGLGGRYLGHGVEGGFEFAGPDFLELFLWVEVEAEGVGLEVVEADEGAVGFVHGVIDGADVGDGVVST